MQGLRAWVAQRLSAVYLLLYSLYLAGRLGGEGLPGDSAAWRAFLAEPLMGSATLVLVLMLLLHAWVGVRDVLIDYVHPWRLRLALLALLAGALLLLG
ncbi:MAG: succinate dehydrogenase, hydrophobic membrane anchor protein, partial [Gammaproteobacteria bacterium]